MFHVKRPVDATDLVEAQAAAWGLSLCHERNGQLRKYARLLSNYDLANVIGTRDVDRILIDHVLDSLSCFLLEPLSHARRLADVGSGGGLPGIPIKIMRPDIAATLVESTGKKARFLRYAVDGLSLRGVEVANTRAEDLGRTLEHRGAYEIVTCRAVGRLLGGRGVLCAAPGARWSCHRHERPVGNRGACGGRQGGSCARG